jgi:Periplasmic copper-binding protein (NosD)
MSLHWTNRMMANRTTLLLAAGGLLVACNRDNEPTAPAVMAAPMRAVDAQAAVDVAQLVPAPVELATPMVCGPITVYDEEDVETLCSPSTLAATPITLPTCPQEAAGSVRLEVDLVCLETSGLIVTSDNTVIDLNGHRIVCQGTGYMGSCQGRAPPAEFDDQRGIDTNGHDNVHIFSHVPGGTIDGFDQGVHVRRGSDNVKVKQLIITGPPATNGPRSGITRGVFVDGAACGDGHVRIGGGSETGNDISNHHRGIEAFQSACVYIGYNRVHDNQGGGSGNGVGGIFITSTSDSHIRSNVVTRNGDGDRNLDAGIRLSDPPTTGNLVVENEANENNPYGIRTAVFAADNYIVNNQMLFNREVDAHSDQLSVNQWNENNRCLTQTTPEPPPGVCSPDDVPPPQ